MNKLNGTPQTLLQAIENGLKDPSPEPQAEVIRQHVVDFLAQRFSVAMLLAPRSHQSAQTQLSALYKATTGVSVK